MNIVVKKISKLRTSILMKLPKIIIFVTLIFAFTASTAFAIPELQLYIEGSTYDPVTETWGINSNSFKLWVMGNVLDSGSKGSILEVYLTAAYPTSTGSISITPTRTSLVSDPSLPSNATSSGTGVSTIPILGDGSSLPPHGVYGEGTSWTKYLIGNFILNDSPVGDLQNTFPPTWSSNKGQINAYEVAITGYSWVHFDAFGYYDKKGDKKYIFAPGSHDAERTSPPPAVPEPATMFLLGSGLIGIGVYARKRFKR